MKKYKIGIFSGGVSSERGISIRSGRAVRKAFQKAGMSTLSVDPARARQMRRILKKIDIAFLALHGHGGEDGSIQRELERNRIPYTGSGVTASRNAFDKRVSKEIFIKSRIPTPPYRVIRQNNWKKALMNFPTPFFVKPVRDGSSVGVFFVENLKASVRRIKGALARYGELLVEKKIDGREFTVGIMGKKTLPVVELVPKRDFYDYRAKYTKGMTQYLIPAPVSRPVGEKLKALAMKVHRSLGLRDFSRVDIMVDDKGRPFVLEANSIPGFTEFSLLPKAARKAGIRFETLCVQLAVWAAERGNHKPGACERTTDAEEKT